MSSNVTIRRLIVVMIYHTSKSVLFYFQDKKWTESKSVPALQADESHLTTLNSPLPTELSPKCLTLPTSREKYQIKEVPKSDYVVVENCIANAAKSEYMIAVDEFLDNGVWNRKLLKKTHLVGIYNSKGHLVALSLFGPSAICRTESLVMGGYVLVNSQHQYQGLEIALVENLTDIAKKLDFEGIAFDIYRTETRFISLLMDMGFKITGSLPEYGYMKDVGYVDSLLLYKEFVIGSSKL